MGTLQSFAKTELDKLNMFSEEGNFYGGETGKAVMELIEVFAKQEHSGMSAPLIAGLFFKLANYQSLTPLLGTEEEWGNVTEINGTPIFQNKRNSGVFKTGESITYSDAVIKRTESTTWNGPLYATREDAIKGENKVRFEVKGFPFTPKTFYIDCYEEEIEKDKWIMWCKDPSQLEEVSQYYNRVQ